MKIKLIRTGGFMPVTRMAETEVDLTDRELTRLLEIIRADPGAPRIKDGQYYELAFGTKSKLVDLEKVPEDYKPLFNKLKSDLRIIK